jgi:hypothetical protein
MLHPDNARQELYEFVAENILMAMCRHPHEVVNPKGHALDELAGHTAARIDFERVALALEDPDSPNAEQQAMAFCDVLIQLGEMGVMYPLMPDGQRPHARQLLQGSEVEEGYELEFDDAAPTRRRCAVH